MRPFSSTIGATAGLALTLALSLAAMPTGAAADVRFIVFGDAPYLSKPPEGRHKRDPFKGKYAQNTLLEDKIAPAIQSAAHPFLIHLGDMKDGAESCTNALIRERYNQLMALHPGRVFHTPGDNDWTDCDRQWLDEPYSEIRRLEFLRTLITSNSMTLPADWHYAIQPEFPENARWTHGGVMFATVPIVGTNNGREEFGEDDPETVRRLVDGDRVVVIEGLVVNVSDRTRRVPPLSASLTDAEGVELDRWTFEAADATLAPGGTTKFETVAKNPPREGNLSIDFVVEK